MFDPRVCLIPVELTAESRTQLSDILRMFQDERVRACYPLNTVGKDVAPGVFVVAPDAGALPGMRVK